ncbi:hypothetical protein HK101_012020 [Irineochytrium annulatum]|nr:hypothetical protein HK101_012020 [Irineochytrium annulatum]
MVGVVSGSNYPMVSGGGYGSNAGQGGGNTGMISKGGKKGGGGHGNGTISFPKINNGYGQPPGSRQGYGDRGGFENDL